MPLLAKALLAVLVLPGVVAFALPLLVIRPAGGLQVVHRIGLVLVALGASLLAACVREFYVAGKGTLAPWSPPMHLVVTGPFRRSRNPMYVAVLTILAGWAVAFASTAHAIYAFVILVVFALRVRMYEEPMLTRLFGATWTEYSSRVPRWIGLRRPGLQPRQARRP